MRSNGPLNYRQLSLILFAFGLISGFIGALLGLGSIFYDLSVHWNIWISLMVGGTFLVFLAIVALVRNDRAYSREHARVVPLQSRLSGIMRSYALARPKDGPKGMRDLQTYIAGIEGLGTYDVRVLKRKATSIREEERRARLLPALQAEIFNAPVRKEEFLYGSDICPRCNSFKNYYKECPECGLLELTL